MIYLSMPVASMHGWGICGKYLARQFDSISNGQTRLLLPQSEFSPAVVGDELEYHAIAPLILNEHQLAAHVTGSGPSRLLNGPLLVAIANQKMGPIVSLRGTRTVGYTFFEDPALSPDAIENLRNCYDVVATGSSWCTDVLRQHGLADVQTVLQGVDGNVFFPAPSSRREFLRDRFVIFSGGKFELRKGQDLVMRAVKVMQDRHRDVFLINAWFNQWPGVFVSMSRSPLIKWADASGKYFDVMNQLLTLNGIDLSRTITLGPRPNLTMARVYHNTDVGVFPNRCEGGTNLVLMEYMACGKPVIATATTGHADVVSAEHALPIAIEGDRSWALSNDPRQGDVKTVWPEPSLSDLIDKLEWAYQNRDAAAALGRKAGEKMTALTWGAAAQRFGELLG